MRYAFKGALELVVLRSRFRESQDGFAREFLLSAVNVIDGSIIGYAVQIRNLMPLALEATHWSFCVSAAAICVLDQVQNFLKVRVRMETGPQDNAQLSYCQYVLI